MPKCRSPKLKGAIYNLSINERNFTNVLRRGGDSLKA